MTRSPQSSWSELCAQLPRRAAIAIEWETVSFHCGSGLTKVLLLVECSSLMEKETERKLAWATRTATSSTKFKKVVAQFRNRPIVARGMRVIAHTTTGCNRSSCTVRRPFGILQFHLDPAEELSSVPIVPGWSVRWSRERPVQLRTQTQTTRDRVRKGSMRIM